MKRALAGACASAALLALFAQLDARLAWLGWVSLVPFIVTLERTNHLRHALAQAWLLAVLFTVAVFGWFASAIADYAQIPPVLAWAALIVVAPCLQPQFFAFAATQVTTRSSTLAVCAWVTADWLFPKLFRDTLGYALHPVAPFRACADIAGVMLLTVALLAVNVLLAKRTRRSVALAVTVIVAMLTYGGTRAPIPGDTLRVGLIQANLTHYDDLKTSLGTFAAVQTILGTHEELSREALEQGASLIVWPETVYPTTFGTPKSDAGRELDERIRSFPAPLIFGTYASDGAHEYNAAVVLKSGQTYRKLTLFPFTERAWMAGTASVVADGIAPLICYDVVDPQLARKVTRDGARLLVTLSNDSWLGNGARWHLVVAAFRSAENHLPQAFATTSGVSALIDARGSILQQTRQDTRETLVGDLALPQHGHTPGIWLEPTLAAVLVAGLIIFSRSRRARRTNGWWPW